ncbi:DUF6438 domain-containing protein [Mucilaginibacter celer]|uniref:DUF6438 domain-containing protein n=1 Tax=Mucilaginibacter celer TaxID=2305508 RepID=A0A494VIN9_9SPHI|nr:DUF6438 domain-containing protein [Mucilaginibacter celer]AYL94786.1 hypothetical protein HYN43_005495 [Mucilaginibacter celer]
MKFLFFFLLLFATQIVSANTIDDLKTNADVARFVFAIAKKQNKIRKGDVIILPADSLFANNGCYQEAHKMNCKTWEKADFNNDGKTDLLVYVVWKDDNTSLLAVIDNGDDTFKPVYVIRKYLGLLPDFPLAKPMMINGTQMLLYRACSGGDPSFKKTKGAQATDTLIFKFGNFIEYNPKPSTAAITGVHVETTMCFGTCPVFKLDVAADGTTTYTATKYNPETGVFTGTIDQEKLTQILSLINYIDVQKLDNNYSVDWTDDQTIKLKVQFADGSVKEITDYGMQGTYGLRYLYQIFFGLRAGQTWYE